MNELSTFRVYNASAGSGKTFTLVKEYLKIILQSDDIFLFQKILAITFTNKAAAEMKERLLDSLESFAQGSQTDLYTQILEETALDPILIQQRSKRVLDAILKNYTAFSITTIDSFTHKIIKSFAYDLGLSLNFEVEMDATELLSESVDMLISKIGIDDQVTKVLLDFSLEKTDDDKSWDISRELNEFSKILLNEDDARHFNNLSKKSLQDFYVLKSKLQELELHSKKEFKQIGEKALTLISNQGLISKNFTRGTVPNFFSDLAEKGTEFDYIKRSLTIQKAIDQHNFYTKTASSDVVESIEAILPQLKDLFYDSRLVYGRLVLLKLSLKSIIPLAVLNHINSELTFLKEENNLQLNSEFNQLISENIKDQPAPFIYERIGQRFAHYFIDEMQDTSVLQWQNLIPLIDNALSQSGSSLMLVGDAKQAIYRWRGGKAEQFIALGSQQENGNPFLVDKKVEGLVTNYRSFSEIINFTNSFFQFATKFITNDSYKDLYVQGNQQLKNSKVGGCVGIDFLVKQEDVEEQKNRYPKAVLAKIALLESKGFSKNEICIIVRYKKDGVAIANYLTDNGVGVVSSETLLLANSAKVNFMIDLMNVVAYPNDHEATFKVLYYLAGCLNVDSVHDFISKHVKLGVELFESLRAYNIFFDVFDFEQKSLYEKAEMLIRDFNLLESSDAYVQFFLDVVLEQQQHGKDLSAFLDFWEQRKDKLSIAVANSEDKVQIMTIHKSKGLQFPVVIFPCDLDIYKQVSPKLWFDDLPDLGLDFQELLIPYSKDIALVNDRGLQLHQQINQELELDNFNLLYVALTRPVEQLHVITDQVFNERFYSGFFKSYLENQNLFSKDEFSYVFGDLQRFPVENKSAHGMPSVVQLSNFISTSKDSVSVDLLPATSKYWGTVQGDAIAYGNQLHEILSKIYVAEDVEKVLMQYKLQGVFSGELITLMEKQIDGIVSHPMLKKYFSQDFLVYNERELIYDNQVKKPDRIVVREGFVTIIDYKTGEKENKHVNQLNEYALVLAKEYVVEQKVLVYINDSVDVQFLN